MVDQVELLPCPFCGKTPALVNEGNGDHARHDWDDCPCDGLMVPVDEWNTRTAYNPNERLREALELAAERFRDSALIVPKKHQDTLLRWSADCRAALSHKE